MSLILCLLPYYANLLTLSCSGFRLSANTGSSPSPLSPLCMTNLSTFRTSLYQPRSLAFNPSTSKPRNLGPKETKKRRNEETRRTSHSTSGNGSVELITIS
jgi:hypothetical protein